MSRSSIRGHAMHRHNIRGLGTAIVAVLSALAVTIGLATVANATPVSPVQATYDRPSLAYGDGTQYISWAANDANGTVNVATFNESTKQLANHLAYTGSSTFYGTGTALAFNTTLNTVVVAWTDLSERIHVAAWGIPGWMPGTVCEGTGFGTSPYTPYLTTDPYNGNLYLTWASTGHHMHVTQVAGISGCLSSLSSLTAGQTTTLTSDTTYAGPALVRGTLGLWLVWAGTDSGHHINVGEFTPGSSVLQNSFEEPHYSTVTDIGAAEGSMSRLFFSYCGTNNDIYVQTFLQEGLKSISQYPASGKCDIYTNLGYTNGGVAIDSNDNTGQMWYAWPDASTYQLNVGPFSLSGP